MGWIVALAALFVTACAAPKPVVENTPRQAEPVVQNCTPSPMTGWKRGKEQDWALAREFEQKVKARNIPIQTESAKAYHLDAQGLTESSEAWKGSYIGLPPSMLGSRASGLRRMVELAGELAATRGEAARIFVEVGEADRSAVKAWLSSGIARARPRRFRPVVEFLPMRKGDVPFVRIEPVDQKQFSLEAALNQG